MQDEQLTLKQVKAYLTERHVDHADCFEKTELIARFRSVQLSEKVADVERIKAKANAAFKRQSFEYAVRLYTDATLAAFALDAVDATRARGLLVTLLSNRARAYSELVMPRAALDDAQQCLRLDPTFVKGYHRLAAAQVALGRLSEAAVALETGLATPGLQAEHKADLTAKLAEVQSKIAATPGVTGGAASSGSDSGGGSKMSGGTAADESGGDAALCGARHLLELSEDLLLEVACQLELRDLLSCAASCQALHRATAARGCGSPWYRLCGAMWPCVSDRLERYSNDLVRRGGGGTAAVDGGGSGGGGCSTTLPLDWHVLLRERRRLATRWERGQHTITTLSDSHHAERHRGPVYGVRMRDDLMVTSSEDATIKVWSLASNSVTHTLEGHSHGILGIWLDPSPHRNRAVSGGFDADIRQWEFSDSSSPKGRCVRTMVGHSGPIVSIEANDEYILSTSFDGTLRMWDWAGRQLSCMCAHEGHSSGLALCGRSGAAYSGGDDGLLKRWDLATETCVDVMEGHEGAVWSVAVGEQVLLSAATSGALMLWDPRVPAKCVHHDARAHSDAIAGLQLDGSKIVSSGFDSLVRLWDLRTLTARAVLQTPVMTRCTRLVFDDTRIITGSLNGTVVVLDVQ